MSALLPTRMVEKPWGRDSLSAPFTGPSGARIGEVWFEPPAALDQLLVKYIFTSEKLSVQVHPSDAELPGQGKEECWLVIAADPGAELGIGFRETISSEAMRAAALDGSIEALLDWHPVQVGDFFYIPAGTIHAIGAGVSLIEVQQNSDTTYRLYDYGRPRELHLDEAIAVAQCEPYDPELRRKIPPHGGVVLVDGPLFRLDLIQGQTAADAADRYGAAPLLVIPLEGEVTIAGEVVAPCQCALAASIEDIAFEPNLGRCLLAQPCTP